MTRKRKSSISDREIGLVKRMVKRGITTSEIQFHFNRPERMFNSGRVADIKSGKIGEGVPCASEEDLDDFLERRSLSGRRDEEVADQGLSGIEALKSWLTEKDDGTWIALEAEGVDIEFKEQISPKKLSTIIRTVAGFANHRGGGIIVGVRDSDKHVVGVDAASAKALDIAHLTNKIKTHLSPTPVFSFDKVIVGKATVFLIHVEPHMNKPVMVVRDVNDDGSIPEGEILFRYPGQSARIKQADLHEILRERDLKAHERMAAIMRNIASVGAENAMIVDIKNGILRDGDRHITINEALAEKLKFIKEGEFNEREGAETLRLIGDVHRVDRDGNIVERVVAQAFQPHTTLFSFLRREAIDSPIEHFRYAMATKRRWLPIFYFISQAKMTVAAALEDIEWRETENPATRKFVTKRLKGEESALSVARGSARPIYDQILCGDLSNIPGRSDAEIDATLRAIQGLPDGFQIPKELYDILIGVAENASENRNRFSSTYKAAARLDEIQFFQERGK